MTEMEWRTGINPEPMLDLFWQRASRRKRRLLAVACCRLAWPLLTDPRARAGVEAAERWADGLAPAREVSAAQAGVRCALKEARLAARPGNPARGLFEGGRRSLGRPRPRFHP